MPFLNIVPHLPDTVHASNPCCWLAPTAAHSMALCFTLWRFSLDSPLYKHTVLWCSVTCAYCVPYCTLKCWVEVHNNMCLTKPNYTLHAVYIKMQHCLWFVCFPPWTQHKITRDLKKFTLHSFQYVQWSRTLKKTCKYKDGALGCDMDLHSWSFICTSRPMLSFQFECCSSFKVSADIYYDTDKDSNKYYVKKGSLHICFI